MQEQAERGGGVQQRTRDAGAGRDQAERGGGCSREPEMQEQVGTRLRGGGCSREPEMQEQVGTRLRGGGGGAAENQRCRSR